MVAYTGAVAPEAIEAVGLMGEDRRDVGLLAVTSADRLNAGWTAAQRARERGLVHARSHIERLMADVPPHCGIVTVCDAHPATLGWLGAIHGHRTRALGVEHFGQTGSIRISTATTASTRTRSCAARGDRAGAPDPLSQGAAVADRMMRRPATLRSR
jgi:pyruvate dehydrogenase complex dehydrogenase (E1) component